MLRVNQYKMLRRGEADVSATGLSPNLERTMSVDFTRILLHYEVGVTLPRTDTGEQNSSRGACKINYFSTYFQYPSTTSSSTMYFSPICGSALSGWQLHFRYAFSWLQSRLVHVSRMLQLILCLYNNSKSQQGNELTTDSERFGILNSFALVFLVFLQRDYPIKKSGISTR